VPQLAERVIHNPWPGYGQQERFGEQCCYARVLNLDADMHDRAAAGVFRRRELLALSFITVSANAGACWRSLVTATLREVL